MIDLAERSRETNKEEFLRWTRELTELDPPAPKALIDLALAYREGLGVEHSD